MQKYSGEINSQGQFSFNNGNMNGTIYMSGSKIGLFESGNALGTDNKMYHIQMMGGMSEENQPFGLAGVVSKNGVPLVSIVESFLPIDEALFNNIVSGLKAPSSNTHRALIHLK